MNRTTMAQENGENKSAFSQQQDSVGYAYEGSYAMYSSNTSAPASSLNQPLPGQPPLPPMPPPPGALPPLPHIFGPVASQVTSIQSWAHPPPPPWQWITSQTNALQSQTQREITNSAYQHDPVARSNYARRDRFNHNRNNVYSPRNTFHRGNKNRRPQQRYEQQQSQGQFETAAYFGQALTGGIGIDWQRTNIAAAQNEALINRMTASIPSHQMTTVNSRISTARTDDESGEQGIKIISEVSLKKSKQRKPMSQNYPSRPWNREDAMNALQIENEYNKTIRAQSLIIKFPDPDLNKDIVREFHPGIQNIHFQSPSGPRYCFVQMSESVDIERAIVELEKIKFGVGNLRVERKSLRDEDNPMPEEIDPYTLYVGNLPESVNVNEVKSKFPTAARVDVGYAQKMRNTRYAFIRYTNVEESIAAYKQAHDLMWDTRSIIVRFRRQRGNTCLPGEPKNNSKKVKEEPIGEQVKNERGNCADLSTKEKQISKKLQSVDAKESEKSTAEITVESAPTSVKPAAAEAEVSKSQKKPNRTSSPLAETASAIQSPPAATGKDTIPETIIIADIKEEPEDYDDMEMSFMEDDDDDDDDDDEDEEEEDDVAREEDIDDIENDNVEDDDDEEDDMIDEDSPARRRNKEFKDSEPTDELDQMFGELENSIACDIEL